VEVIARDIYPLGRGEGDAGQREQVRVGLHIALDLVDLLHPRHQRLVVVPLVL
jgi:hypothetical protein